MYIFKNPGQEGKEAKYLIHIYLGSFTDVLWQWFCKIGPDQ